MEETKSEEASSEVVNEQPPVAAAPVPKPRWGDEEPDIAKLDITGSDDGGTVDAPDLSIKTGKLNDEVEDSKIQKEIVDSNSLYTSVKRFEDLNIPEPLLRALYTVMKFDRPSKIQAEALPLILNPPHGNLVAQAHNGSGKTVCFMLAMLSRVDPSLYEPQALCICPTRELALQNQAVMRKMATYAGISDVCAVPSDNRDGRVSRRPPVHDHIVIGTPGTMKRWITADRCLSVKNVKIVVFDEADFMLDTAGFQDESVRMLRAIIKESPSCQILLFSATFNDKVKTFVERMIPRANKVFVAKEELSLDVIKQYRVRCPSVERKIEVLKDRIYPLAEKLGQSIIFARTRESVRQLHQKLEEDGYRCTPIEGGQRPDERDRVIQDFRTGKTRILISTDVLARGFDVAQVTLVVNFDLPEVQGGRYREPDYETYLHRIGRSGRFGRKGAAFNFTTSEEDERVVDKIENYFKKKIPPVRWDDDDDFERVMKEAGLR